MLELRIDTKAAMSTLQRLAQKAAHLGPVLRAIGEDLTESTKKRFESGSGPEGQAWAANKASTLEHKTGSRPLVGNSGGQAALGTSIAYQLQGSDGLLVGSGKEYAAMQQFGGTKAEFPHLWGDIPARPYLGLSAQDCKEIELTVEYYLMGNN